MTFPAADDIDPSNPSRPMPGARDWATIGVAISLAALPALMPVMVAVLTPAFNLDNERAGFVVSSNMGGLMAGSLIANLVLRFIDERQLLVGGILLMVAANILSMAPLGYPALLAARAVSGGGTGVALAIAYGLMADSNQPARVMGFYSAGQGVLGVLGMGGLLVLAARYGLIGFYLVISAIGLLGLALVPAAMAKRIAPPKAAAGSHGFPIEAITLLATAFAFFFGMALIWAFLAPIAAGHGFDTTRVAVALSTSAAASIAGSMAAAMFAHRLPTAFTLVAAVLLVILSALGLTMNNYLAFAGAVFLTSFTWTFAFPFLFRCVAVTEGRRRTGALVPVATSAGLTVGPAAGGILLDHGGIGPLTFVFAIVAGGALLLPAILGRNGFLRDRAAGAAS